MAAVKTVVRAVAVYAVAWMESVAMGVVAGRVVVGAAPVGVR